MFDTVESRPLQSHEAFYAHKQRIYVYAQPLCEILPDPIGIGGIAVSRFGTDSRAGSEQEINQGIGYESIVRRTV